MAHTGADDRGTSAPLPHCGNLRQFTILMERGNFQLAELLNRFEQRGVSVLGLSIFESPECVLVRLLLTQPDVGRDVLERAGLAIIETNLLAVELAESRQSLLGLCRTLLQANVKIVHVCPLPIASRNRLIVAVMVEDLEAAASALRARGYRIVSEEELAY
ncbi:MAG: acetolactate synthase [Thermoguttaceae bacterium]|nr:acetolactate synthase [Thermoguttaceae bacterium]MDW8077261.1 acetolactate synthase [Thermoguttaceae bacterium]